MSMQTLPGLAPEQTLFRELAGDTPVVLEPGRAWFVRAGRVDVFATRLEDGAPAGPRHHLFRAGAGELLLGTGADPASGIGLLAVGAAGTSAAECDGACIRALALEPHVHRALAERLHGWVARLYEAMAADPGARRLQALAPGEDWGAGPGCVRPAAAVGWLEVREGTPRVVGREAGRLAPGDLVPVAAEGWVEDDAPFAARLFGTEHLLSGEVPEGRERLWEALERLHAVTVRVAAERIREADAAHRRRAEARAGSRQAVMVGALSRLSSPLARATRGAGTVRGAGGALEDLAAAFRAVAEAQGIDTGAAPALRRDDARDPVAALARAHRVRVRQVVLRGAWWEADGGPLLGVREEGKRPVALLPAAGGGYEVHDVRGAPPVRVDAKTAVALLPVAYTLYRPFPLGETGLAGVLRFGMRGSRRDLVTVLAAAAAIAGLGMLTPMGIAWLYDVVIPGAERGLLWQLALGMLAAAVAAGVFQLVRGTALLRMEARMGASLQAAVWDHLLRLPLPFFRDYSAGNLAVRAMGIEEIRKVLSGTVVNTLLGGVFSVFNFALLVHYDARLAGLAAGLIAVALAATSGVTWVLVRRQREILDLRSRTSGVVLQLLAGIAKVKMMGAEMQAFGVWARMFGDQREKQLRVRALGNLLRVFNVTFPVLATLVIFAAASRRLGGADALTPGTFLGFMAAFNLCLNATLASGGALLGVLSVIPLYEQVRPILRAEPEAHAGKADPGDLGGAVELRNVSFRYHADGPAVVRDVSLKVRPGEFVAFVGPSGSGKSTLLRLLLGFETPESGAVAFDGQDLGGLDVQAVRRQIGTVWQNGGVMAGSIFTNIVGASTAGMDEAWEAARMAGLEDDVRAMPMGMHTPVGDGGGTFSGGQKQRLMIARAVVGRPRILLFDEATSALDNHTQAAVSESLEGLKATRIVVAHRLSTVRNADRIYVVDGGRIVESGTCGELMAAGGLFHAMAGRQLA